jgi:hypothetical protein
MSGETPELADKFWTSSITSKAREWVILMRWRRVGTHGVHMRSGGSGSHGIETITSVSFNICTVETMPTPKQLQTEELLVQTRLGFTVCGAPLSIVGL